MLDERQKAQFTNPVLNTIPQAIVRLNTSRSKLYEKIAAGEIEAVKLDGRTMIPETALQAFALGLPRFVTSKEAA